MTLSEHVSHGPVSRKRWWTAAMALLMLVGAGYSTVVKNVNQAVYSKPKYGTDRFVLVRGYNIHYVEGGEGQPVLLIPGAFTTYRTWNGVVPSLLLHNRVLAVDYVGVGDSDKPDIGFRYTIEEQADVMAEMVQALGLSRVNVVGASYGGAVALNLAARYPHLVGKVVCIEGGALITPEALNYSTLGDLIEWPILGSIIWGFMKSGLFDGITARSVMGAAWDELSPEERKDITGIFSANIMTASRPSWISIYRAITHRIDFIEPVEQTRVPVLYLYGKDSKYRAVAEMNARIFAEHNPNIEVISFQGGIHDLHLQYPRDVARMILRFMGTEPGIVASGVAIPGAGERADLGELIRDLSWEEVSVKPSERSTKEAFRILLVSPVDQAVLGRDFYFRFPHLSLPTLASYTPEGVGVEIVDEKFRALPDATGYDLVGITAMTPLAPRAYRIADTFRKQGVPVVLGGYHPTVLPDEALEHADSVCVGEAEGIWPRIVADAMTGRLRERYQAETFPCLEKLPQPRRDLLKVPRSRRFEHINVYFLQTTRGCPYRCSFCAVTSVLGGKLRHRPVAEVEAEIESLGIRRLERGQKRDRFHDIIFFTDDNIVGHRSYSRELLRMVSSFNLKWVGQASTNVADHEEILALLRDSGCMGLAVGFETLSQKNIRDVGKGVNRTQDYLDRIRKIHSYGIGLAGNFIFGFDQDDETVFAEVADFVDTARLEGFYYSLLTPYPGTPFFEQMQTEGRILERDWSLYDTDHVVYAPRLMDPETLMQGYRWAWRRSLTYRSIFTRLLGSRNQLIFFGPMNYGMRQTILAHS